MNQKVGIYKIMLVSLLENRVLYVGQSSWLQTRWKAHLRELARRQHVNIHLQRVYDKYGPTNIKFEIIRECQISELDSLEQFYIDELKPECNVIKIVGSLWEKDTDHERADLDTEIQGLEHNWKPKLWHRWVYGAGRKS